ncbi:MAG: SAM-dependent methyltransferase [Spirochaetaceae bacterium]|jgi:hypothetical protein|nr:SAM-dependent methyltransferase [Spirochaetaceae bacterium]
MMGGNAKTYIENLNRLNFTVEEANNSSVYIVNRLNHYLKDRNIPPQIILALEKAKGFKADAVYFRFFDEGRPPQAQIYIYDNTLLSQSEDDHIKIHRDIWSSCDVPAYLVIDKDEIKVYDGRAPIMIDKGKEKCEPIDKIDLGDLDNAIKLYNAENFNTGAFWEEKNVKRHFAASNIASERLVKGLRGVRNKIRDQKILPPEFADRLLIVCILIKYLEDTGFDETTGNNLAELFFKKETGYITLSDIIRKRKLGALLKALAGHFNGGIFTMDDKGIELISQANLNSFAGFFEANYKDDLFSWREYSFENIPVELISNFYEELIPKTKSESNTYNKKSTGAVYTPSFLVNLLVDECLPLDKDHLNENVKIIDPSCGSGIFLVTAYKRLVQRWRINESLRKGKLADTNAAKLKDILSQNIFGVDINPVSVNLTIFSLQLALCSMLTPKEIWTNLGRFINLQKQNNIVQADFFEYLLDEKTKKDFDIVLGNPPFALGELAGVRYEHYQDMLSDTYPIKFNNPSKEFAFLFMEKTMHLLKKDTGKLCLILPSSHFLYAEDSISMRKSMIKEYNVSQIIDFTFLRRVLFRSTVVTMALFADNTLPDEKPICHITAKRTKSSKERMYFEFDNYDLYSVIKDMAIADDINIWKCNLLGGSRVYNVFKKMNDIKPKLSNFYYNEKIVANNTVHEEYIRKEGIIDKNDMPLFAPVQEKNVAENRYWGIRKLISKGKFPIDITLSDFNQKKNKENIEGIAFRGSKEAISKLKGYFSKNSDLLCFYIAVASNRLWSRGPYIIYKSDFNGFPFKDNLCKNFTETEKVVINDVVKYTLIEYGNGEKAKTNTTNAKMPELREFARIYCVVLNNYYENDAMSYQLTHVFENEAYYLCEITYTNTPRVDLHPEWMNNSLDNILEDWNVSRSAKTNRIARIYSDDGNKIYIIKPKLLRFWLKSKALRDADATYDDIVGVQA